MEKEKIVLATTNQGKLKELQVLLGDRFDFVTLTDLNIDIDFEECAHTFEGNALSKAKTIYKMTNLRVLADDSGLSVDSLSGEPGIYSARYGGSSRNDELNNKVLLQNMRHKHNREAHFMTVLVLYDGVTDTYYKGEGKTLGAILQEPVGTNGFGYDPLFFSHDLSKSFGLATDEEKNTCSHRQRAAEDLLNNLRTNTLADNNRFL